MRGAAVLLGLLVLAAPGCFGQAPADRTITVDPVMARGPATAPVIIVEFSDYQ
jgi:hypothetical protein